MRKLLTLFAALFFATAALAQVTPNGVTTLPIAAMAVADVGNGPVSVRMTQGNASIFTSQGSGVGSTVGSSTSLTLTATPATAPLVGALISGNGITSGTTVTAYSGTSITLSAAMTVPASTTVSWGAACPASAAGIPSRYIAASVMADYYVLYTQARVCAISPGGPNNALITLPIFYNQTSPSGSGGGSTLPSLPSGQIWVGSGAAVATARTISGAGDCTTSLSNVGVFTYVCTKTNGVNFGALATLTPGAGVATALTATAGGAGGFALVGSTPPTGAAGGDLTGTYPNPTLAVANANVGTFGGAATALSLTADAKGRIIGVTSLTISLPTTQLTGTLQAAQEPAHTGDVTNSAGSLALTIATVNANVGTFGTATSSLTLTANAKGQITGVTGVTITPAIGNVTGLGSGVATQLALPVSTAGGSTATIQTGTMALGTSSIASGACATVVTATATGITTTDVPLFGFNSDPKASTGYAPGTAGMLTIQIYPSSNAVNANVCNNTAGAIVPSPITLNWRVLR